MCEWHQSVAAASHHSKLSTDLTSRAVGDVQVTPCIDMLFQVHPLPVSFLDRNESVCQLLTKCPGTAVWTFMLNNCRCVHLRLCMYISALWTQSDFICADMYMCMCVCVHACVWWACIYTSTVRVYVYSHMCCGRDLSWQDVAYTREPLTKWHLHQTPTWWTNDILLSFLSGVWVRGHLQEQGWLKNSYITKHSTLTWVTTHSSQKLHPGALPAMMNCKQKLCFSGNLSLQQKRN